MASRACADRARRRRRCATPAYCKLHLHLLSAAWPPTLGNRAAIVSLIATQGIRRLQQAISGGQHERPGGLFFTGICMEFGTQPLLKVLRALRGDQWLQLHPDAPQPLARDIKGLMVEAFFVDTPEWKQGVLSEVHEAAAQALEGLRRDG